MHPTKKAARIAGAVYLSMVLTGPISLIYIPNKLIVRGNAAATAINVVGHESLARMWIIGDLWTHVIIDDPHPGETFVTYNVDRRRRSVVGHESLARMW